MVLSILILLFAFAGIFFFRASLAWGIPAMLIAAAGIALPVLFKTKWKKELLLTLQIGCGCLAFLLIILSGQRTYSGVEDYRDTLFHKTKKVGKIDDLNKMSAGERDLILAGWALKLVEDGKPEEAQEYADAMTDKTSRDYYDAMTQILAQKEDYPQAAALYGEAAQNYPTDYPYQLLAGYSYLFAGECKTAQYYLERAINLTEDTSDAELALSLSYAGQDELIKAQNILDDLSARVGEDQKELKEGIKEAQEILDQMKEGEVEEWIEKWGK